MHQIVICKCKIKNEVNVMRVYNRESDNLGKSENTSTGEVMTACNLKGE